MIYNNGFLPDKRPGEPKFRQLTGVSDPPVGSASETLFCSCLHHGHSQQDIRYRHYVLTWRCRDDRANKAEAVEDGAGGWQSTMTWFRRFNHQLFLLIAEKKQHYLSIDSSEKT